MSNALIIVDVQYDFLPGRVLGHDHTHAADGALAVPNGDDIIDGLNRQYEDKSYDCDMIVASYDWHPKNHCSFVENGGQWPAHCVQNTFGANLEQTVLDISDFYVEKGGNPEKEAYSAFDGFVMGPFDGHNFNYRDKKPLLGEFLRNTGVNSVDICGLALEYCVFETAISARELGFKTSVFLDLTRPVKYEDGMKSIAALAAQDIDLKISRYIA